MKALSYSFECASTCNSLPISLNNIIYTALQSLLVHGNTYTPSLGAEMVFSIGTSLALYIYDQMMNSWSFMPILGKQHYLAHQYSINTEELSCFKCMSKTMIPLWRKEPSKMTR